MRRRLFTLASLLSLLLTIGLVLCASRLDHVYDDHGISYETATRTYCLFVREGSVYFAVEMRGARWLQRTPIEPFVLPNSAYSTLRKSTFLGLQYMSRYSVTASRSMYCFGISLWTCSVATVLLAAYLYRKRFRPLTEGLCACCSYNLRGNISGVCPECGTAISN